MIYQPTANFQPHATFHLAWGLLISRLYSSADCRYNFGILPRRSLQIP